LEQRVLCHCVIQLELNLTAVYMVLIEAKSDKYADNELYSWVTDN